VNRSIAYIESALKRENLTDDDENTDEKAAKVDLIGVKHDAHIVHKTHCIPALEKFISGEWKDVWFDSELPCSNDYINFRQNTPTWKNIRIKSVTDSNIAVSQICNF
jgi:hypothetical protein